MRLFVLFLILIFSLLSAPMAVAAKSGWFVLDAAATDASALPLIEETKKLQPHAFTVYHSGVSDKVLEAVSEIKSLKTVWLFRGKDATYTGKGIKKLAALPSLTFLKISSDVCDLLPGEAEAIGTLRNLKTLRLFWGYLGDELAAALANHPSLEHIEAGQFNKGCDRHAMSDKGAALLATIPGLKSLSFGDTGAAALTGDGILELGKIAGLEELHLGKNLHPKGPDVWKSIGTTPGFPKLKKLVIGNKHTGEDFTRVVATMPALHSLTYGYYTAMGPEVANLAKSKTLESLELGFGETFGEEGWAGLGQVQTLKNLKIRYMRVGFTDAPRSKSPSAVDEVARLKNLEYLDLSEAELGTTDFSALGSLTKLRHLNLLGSSHDTLAFLAKLPQLECLLLGGTYLREFKVKPETLAELALAKNLKKLLIVGDLDDSAEVSNLVKDLSRLPKLQVLQTSIPISNDDLKVLSTAPELTTLIVWSDRMSAEGMQALLDFPKLSIFASTIPDDSIVELLPKLRKKGIEIIDKDDKNDRRWELSREIFDY